MISEKFDGQVMLDKLSKDLADSIDKQILYEAMGWTIVTAPSWSFYTGNALDMLEWLDTQCGKYHCWDGLIAFEQGKDATMFILRWK